MPGKTTTRVIALDTEDDSQGTVTLINFFDGLEHVTFAGPGMRERAWGWLQTVEPAWVWACNLEYDLINLFGDWLGKLTTLQYVSAGLMRATSREARVQFFDTLRHWPASVENMGREIGLHKLEATFDGSVDYMRSGLGGALSFIGLLTYCRRDTEIVWRYVVAMLERYEALDLKIRPTLPAMALQLFRKTFYRKSFVRLPHDVLEFFRQGYYGGRVEVFRLGKVGMTARDLERYRDGETDDDAVLAQGAFHHYDVNSLFPSMMAVYKFPSIDDWWTTERPDWSREGMADVTLEYPYQWIPCLPVRHETEILYPHGRLRGTWPYPEIRQAIEDGAQVLRVHRAVEFPHAERPFREYVEFCYGRRLGATSDVDKTFWKLMMNSLYGKFGQSNKGMLTIFDDEEIRPESEKLSEHVNVVWSAYVTAYARLTLLRFLRACEEVYYTDTDSLFTPTVLPTSAKLGDLKHEGVILQGEFKGNKLYLLTVKKKGTDHETTEVAKAKGVRAAAAGDFIRNGRAVFRRPARFRESRRSFVIAKGGYEGEKMVQTQYTKRRRRRDGSGWTEPWALNEYTSRVDAIRVRGQTDVVRRRRGE